MKKPAHPHTKRSAKFNNPLLTNNAVFDEDAGLHRSPDFLIVGIGASAGGLEALEQFFDNVPSQTGMAFVVIQHLDPDHKGIMPELLQRFTTMDVLQATERIKVLPDCVYVIPPNKSMSLLHGYLHLFEPVEARGLRLPIDLFFRSLAIDKQEKSIGVILSGMGSDGSLGVKAIKEKNGVVLVQDPANARFDGMPRSAADAVIADFIAPAGDLPGMLFTFLSRSTKGRQIILDKQENKSNIEKIIILLREQSGHDFSFYKKNTIFRRIERRMGIHQIEKMENYVRFLQENPHETGILFKELLIGVTSFFRDKEVWDYLKEDILPQLLHSLPEKYTLRAWITGCSTGEEAYSLAIILAEIKEKTPKFSKLSFQIFATDLDAEAIEKARKGFFVANIAADVTPERLHRFFIPVINGYQINTSIREMVIFAPQNVIKDPPFTKLDILLCRNILIYMEPELQRKLIALFNYSLNRGGLLVLGSSESLGIRAEGFAEISEKHKIFKHTARAMTTEFADFPSSFYHRKAITTMRSKVLPQKDENIQSLAEQLLLQHYTPASVMVDKNGDILYITGRTGKFLEPPADKVNWNIYAMARQGLNELLPGAFRRALRSYEPVKLHHVKVGSEKDVVLVDVTLQCVEHPQQIKGFVLVLFKLVPPHAAYETIQQKNADYPLAQPDKELIIELHRSHEDLQIAREEHQKAQEELKTINEELQSTNEELQSTNEELTTSKEEMQSLNEELQTVNIELQSKISDHVRVNEDMTNLLNSIDIAILFLDKNLHIRRFTDQLTHIFKLRESDIERPFTDLVSTLNYPELENHARQVLKTLVSIITDVETKDKKWFSVKIMPYRTTDDHINGLVLTFTDISIAKKLEIELTKANSALRNADKKQATDADKNDE
ncbi:MAG: chemotaxis protein CheB [Bacteroidales bacterium]|jgi:two-component system CheB/CheR fusion protein|nr:chemotaxis protein CheB [Bacteroidales bacterium]MDD4178269.1 chemotaxis protein CheB [Bacteroidales bacterium]MDY0335171.1 chemotaxis protein CheB [Bacteroidales bacterium]NCA86945.1 chemotaxis protein CheB [Clostridia bacterium]